MKPITYLAAFTVGAAAIVGSSFVRSRQGWTNDLEKAFADARAENKAVLVEFTGSDWCPPCIAMHREVFSKSEFVKKASEDFILVELDFPKGNSELKAKNQPYAEKYRIEGFPTVILFNQDGKEFSRFFASDHPNTEQFLGHLQSQLQYRDRV